MLLKDQVCTLNQAKRLKDLGVKQKAIFCHYFNKTLERWTIALEEYASMPVRYSAFNVAELVQMNGNIYNIEWSVKENKYYSNTDPGAEPWSKQFTYYPTFAQACADKLIQSLEEGFIDAEMANERLMQPLT